VSSGRTQFNFLLSTGSPAEPLDTTGGTLRFRGTPVEEQVYREATSYDHQHAMTLLSPPPTPSSAKNRLPHTVRRKESTDSFKMALKTFLHSDADVFDT